mgnify:CR=1 FL=1|tara:strand:- start:2049 stop:2561 length:513 start_codon:yes stop_codon:yes gene_type:complete
MVRTLMVAALTLLAIAPAAESRQREVDSGSNTGTAGGATAIGMNQFIQMAEEVMYDFVVSSSFERVTAGSELPRIVIGEVSNRSHYENILPGELIQPMRQVLVGTGMVRIFREGVNEFDYIITSRLDSTDLRGSGGRRARVERTYTLSIRVESIYGEIIAEHSVTRSYVL